MTLPVATAACIEARTDNDRCDDERSFSEEYGDKEGACAVSLTVFYQLVLHTIL